MLLKIVRFQKIEYLIISEFVHFCLHNYTGKCVFQRTRFLNIIFTLFSWLISKDFFKFWLSNLDFLNTSLWVVRQETCRMYTKIYQLFEVFTNYLSANICILKRTCSLRFLDTQHCILYAKACLKPEWVQYA